MYLLQVLTLLRQFVERYTYATFSAFLNANNANKMRTVVDVTAINCRRVRSCQLIEVVIQDEVRTGMSKWEDKAIEYSNNCRLTN